MFRMRFTTILLAAATLAGCSKDPEVAKREFVARGDRYAAEHKLQEAIIEYRNAVQQDPRFAEARLKLADAYLKVGDAGSAFGHLIRAADLLPDDAAVQVRAGNALLFARRFEDAKARADQVLEVDPGEVDALILRANALAGLDRIDDAIAQVEDAISRAPERSASYASLGTMRMIQGDRAQAERAFRHAVQTDPSSISARLALANFLWAARQSSQAETEMKAALSLNPRDELANRAIAAFYMGSGRAADAEPHLKTVAEVAPNASGTLALADYYVVMRRPADAQKLLASVGAGRDATMAAVAKLKLAGLAAAANDSALAGRLVDEVLAKQPSNADALTAKAELQMGAGRLDEALRFGQRAAEAAPQSAPARLVLGRIQARRHEADDAMRSFGEALRLNPRLAPAEVEIARLHLTAGRLAEAEQFATGAVSRMSSYAEAHLLLARIHLIKGEPEKAEPSLRGLARAFPDSPAVQTELGLLEFRKNNPTAARAAFERALSGNPASVDALAGMIRLDLQEKRPDAARRRLATALAARPSDALLLRLAAETENVLADPEAVEAYLLRAIEADPNDPTGYSQLGAFYASQRRLEDAVRQLEQLAERQPQSVGAHTSLGTLLQIQNRTAEARARYEQALAIDAQAPVAANNLAWIYAEEGSNLDEALRLAQTAKARLPNRAEVNDTLAWVYVKKGLGALAIPLLRQSLQVEPRNPSYHFHLGMAYVSVGDAAGARASFERTLALNPAFPGAAGELARLKD